MNQGQSTIMDAPALVDRPNPLLCAGHLPADTLGVIKNALGTPALTASSNESSRNNRIYAAILLVMGCPEYLVQK